jgi:TolB-like protein/Tfp pilus assembly protein PilF
MRLMTPEYASPEQVRGAEISPSSDIYSLGTVLYELLTAHRPYNLANQALHEITRIICETEPEPPSRVIRQTENLLPALSAEQKTLNQIAENRNTDLAALETELSGGLDRIVLKALAKTKESRYRTVKDFSDDIERRLTGEVVLAEELDVLRRSADSDSRIATTSERSIAVLPFRLLQTGDTTEAEDKFLGLGLADALIMHLSATKRLIVRPIGSVLRYLKDEDNSFDLLAAGRELGVRFILDGFINRQGARIRVSVQLLNVEDNKTIWAGRFDEDYTNVLTLEDVISTRVAESLIPHLTVDERAVLAKRGTENVRAYEAYLRGRYHWKMFTEESFAKAIEAFNEAVAIDPDYALAYVGIADYYNWLKSFGVGPYHDFAVKAKQAGLMAIKLDPQLPEAYISLAQSSLIADLDWKRAEGYCLRALELNPYNADAHSSYAYHLFSEGQFDKGLFHARRAVEIEPQTPNNHHTEYWGLYFARRFDEAIRKAENVISNHPLYGFAYFARSWFLRFIGRHDEALAASERAIEIMGESVLTLTGHAASLAAAGKIAETEKLLEKFRSEKYYVSPYQFALIYCYLGEKEKALKALDETFEQREGFLIWFGIEPTLDILRNEPRFQNLLKSTRNPIVKSISPINKNYDDTTQAYS